MTADNFFVAKPKRGKSTDQVSKQVYAVQIDNL